MIKKAIIILFAGVLIVFAGTKTLAQTSTESADPILQKIKDKVESIRKNPKAYLGIVTDKTQDSIQIKNMTGKIQQIAINESVQFAKIDKTTTNIKFTDIALGDFIIAMGFTDTNSVLEARRILAISPLNDPKRKIIYGNISSFVKKDMVVTTRKNESVSLTFPKTWKGPDLKELSVDMEVLVVAQEVNGKLTIRTIQIVGTEQKTTIIQKSTVTPTIKK